MILLCLLHRLFCLYAPEVLYGLVLVFARMLGLRAESVWMCRSCTFMLLENIIFGGIFSHIGWTTLRRCPVWFLLCLLACYCPLFPPKKKSDAEKAEIARAELEQFVAEHVPDQLECFNMSPILSGLLILTFYLVVSQHVNI
jgi:Zn-finger protein